MKTNLFRGCLLGGAIGDALGYQIEFFRGIKDKEYTKYKNDKGIISDDTQMTLFTANGILWRETALATNEIAPEIEVAIYYSYLDWLETQNKYKANNNTISWIKNIPELNMQRAPGLTCLSALSSGNMGTLNNQINDSKGCGGVMRVAPLGLYAKNPKLAGELGAKVSAITHSNIFSSLSSFVFTSMINIIVNTNDTIFNALKQSLKLMNDFFISNKLCTKVDLKNFIKIIDFAVDLSTKDIEDTKAIKLIGEGWIAEEALAIALYSCLKYCDDFKATIVCAVNHDGDSDSTGAIAGNIIGAYLGFDKIPNYFVDNVELKDIILEIADDLAILNNSFKNDIKFNDYWLSKYINCQRNLNLKNIV